MSDTKKPAIRFQGFSDEWKQSRVGELIEDYTEKTVVQNQYPVLTSSQQQGIVRQEEYFADRQVTTNDNVGYFVLPFGYFTYRSRSDTDVFVFNRNDLMNKGIISYYYPVFAPKSCDSNFLLRRLNYGIKKQLSMAAEGTGQKVLAHNKFKDMIVDVPDEKEQIKIGVIFEYIDNLIAQHQSKLEKLQAVKASMLEKMFPKDGADIPEIRFKGFTGAWDKYELGKLCEKFTDGDWIESKDQSNSGLRLIQTGNIGIAEYLDKPRSKKWISNETFERLHCEEVFPGDILISRLPEPAGRACIVPDIGVRMITAVDCTIVRTNSGVSNKFLVQYLSSQRYFDKVNAVLAGGTRQRISRSNLSSLSILISKDFKEQEAIGNYFTHLNTVITLQQQKLDKLQSIKKALLEKMFV